MAIEFIHSLEVAGDLDVDGKISKTGGGDSTQWDTAYGWGDHSDGGYSTSDTNYYLNGVSWNSGNGIITLGRQGLNSLTVDIDGRYLVSSHKGGGDYFAGHHSEGRLLANAYLSNDLGNARKRGSEFTLTNTSLSEASIDYMFDGLATKANIPKTDFEAGPVVIEFTVPRTLRYGAYVGIGFGNSTWRCKDVKIEAFSNGAWVTCVHETNNAYEDVYTNIPGNSGVGTTKFRYTLSKPNNNVRVCHIWAYNFDSELWSQVMMPRSGGRVYGGLSLDGTLNTHTIPSGTGTLALTSDIPTDFVSKASGGTFGGSLDVNGTASDISFVGGSMNFKDSNSYIRITKQSASAQIGLFREGDGGMYIGGSKMGFRLYTEGFAEKLLIDQSGNATFQGTLSASGYNKTNWDAAYEWGDHGDAGYLTTSGKAADSEKLDGLDSTVFYRTVTSSSGTAGAGWITVAKNHGSRKHGEVIVSDAESSDHAFIRIDWMRSYADSNVSVINVGGHANRITGVRVLSQDSDDTYGWKYLQVYVTTSSNYRVRINSLGDPYGFSRHESVTPVVQDTLYGYSVHGNVLTNLQNVSLAAEEGIKAGGVIYASGGDSTAWNTAYTHSQATHAPTNAEANVYSTAAQLLTAIKTVDGSGSGLDADTLDTYSSASFARKAEANPIFTGGLLKQNSRYQKDVISKYPLGHYTPGDTVFEIDPTWSDAEIKSYFNTTSVSWAKEANAPGGYSIYIEGSTGAGGVYGSGFPMIPIDQDATYYQECWIKNATSSTMGHYMGSNDYEADFTAPASGSGNPGSYGYWVMSNTNPGDEWTKVSGYITGHHDSNSGNFETDATYFTPLALFNYTNPAAGTRACWISGWKIIRVDNVGDRIFQDAVQVKGKLEVHTLDANTSSATALVMNSNEVEKRTLGSLAFSSATIPTDHGDHDGLYLEKEYTKNWTRVGYGNSGGTRYHKLATITITQAYTDYNATFDWTGRYASGTAGFHIHSDGDLNADAYGGWYEDHNPSYTLEKTNGWIKYSIEGPVVEIWIKTTGWREFDYIRKDSVTEGTPAVVWYDEKTTTDQETEPEFLKYFRNRTHTAAGYSTATGVANNAEVNVQANWSESSTSSDAFIQNKPTIPTVPDSYAPINAEQNVQSNWTAKSGDAYIQNKPTIPTDHSGKYLPIGGGTITGNLTVNGKVTQAGVVGRIEWGRTYAASITTIATLVTSEGSELPTGGGYRMTAHISGTGTDQVAMAVFWNENGTWYCNNTYAGGTSSNHIEFLISSGVPKIKTWHSVNYNIQVTHERLTLTESGTDNLRGYFGSDSYLKWTETTNTLVVPGTIGATNLSGTNTGDQDLSSYLTSLPAHDHDGRYLRLYPRLKANASTITASGIHIWDVSESDDKPTGAADGLLTTKFWDSSGWAVQSYHDFHSNKLYLRSKQSGTWQTDWAQVHTTDQFSTAEVSKGVTAYGWGNHASAGYLKRTKPEDPKISSKIVGETIEVIITASGTSNIDQYLVFSSIVGSDFGLIAVLSPEDFSSTMSVIDTNFDKGGKIEYRVYAVKQGVYSDAATTSQTFSVGEIEPTNLSVVDFNTAKYIQWDAPSSKKRFVSVYNVYHHEHDTKASLLRSSATLIYSGTNTSYMKSTSNNKFHQFWVEITES